MNATSSFVSPLPSRLVALTFLFLIIFMIILVLACKTPTKKPNTMSIQNPSITQTRHILNINVMRRKTLLNIITTALRSPIP